MSASELNIRILLRIKAVAEAKGIGDPTRLAEISGLPISIAESLWNQPSQESGSQDDRRRSHRFRIAPPGSR